MVSSAVMNVIIYDVVLMVEVDAANELVVKVQVELYFPSTTHYVALFHKIPACEPVIHV
jgi:hypothetical protein